MQQRSILFLIGKQQPRSSQEVLQTKVYYYYKCTNYPENLSVYFLVFEKNISCESKWIFYCSSTNFSVLLSIHFPQVGKIYIYKVPPPPISTFCWLYPDSLLQCFQTLLHVHHETEVSRLKWYFPPHPHPMGHRVRLKCYLYSID